MKAYVGVTDLDWYRRLLASGPEHDEVNFWLPSAGQGFGAIVVGHVIPQGLLSRNSPGVGLVLVLPVGAGVV